MSREIKFRAWDKENGYYADYEDIEEEITAQAIDGWRSEDGGTSFTLDYGIKDFELEQYTGLKDKNGKEIYEGDIVEQFVCGIHQFKGKKCGRSTIWQVRWNKKECCFELHYLNGSLFGDSMMSDGDEYEVIGNIHETPELLEDK